MKTDNDITDDESSLEAIQESESNDGTNLSQSLYNQHSHDGLEISRTYRNTSNEGLNFPSQYNETYVPTQVGYFNEGMDAPQSLYSNDGFNSFQLHHGSSDRLRRPSSNHHNNVEMNRSQTHNNSDRLNVSCQSQPPHNQEDDRSNSSRAHYSTTSDNGFHSSRSLQKNDTDHRRTSFQGLHKNVGGLNSSRSRYTSGNDTAPSSRNMDKSHTSTAELDPLGSHNGHDRRCENDYERRASFLSDFRNEGRNLSRTDSDKSNGEKEFYIRATTNRHNKTVAISTSQSSSAFGHRDRVNDSSHNNGYYSHNGKEGTAEYSSKDGTSLLQVVDHGNNGRNTSPTGFNTDEVQRDTTQKITKNRKNSNSKNSNSKNSNSKNSNSKNSNSKNSNSKNSKNSIEETNVSNYNNSQLNSSQMPQNNEDRRMPTRAEYSNDGFNDSSRSDPYSNETGRPLSQIYHSHSQDGQISYYNNSSDGVDRRRGSSRTKTLYDNSNGDGRRSLSSSRIQYDDSQSKDDAINLSFGHYNNSSDGLDYRRPLRGELISSSGSHYTNNSNDGLRSSHSSSSSRVHYDNDSNDRYHSSSQGQYHNSSSITSQAPYNNASNDSLVHSSSQGRFDRSASVRRRRSIDELRFSQRNYNSEPRQVGMDSLSSDTHHRNNVRELSRVTDNQPFREALPSSSSSFTSSGRPPYDQPPFHNSRSSFEHPPPSRHFHLHHQRRHPMRPTLNDAFKTRPSHNNNGDQNEVYLDSQIHQGGRFQAFHTSERPLNQFNDGEDQVMHESTNTKDTSLPNDGIAFKNLFVNLSFCFFINWINSLFRCSFIYISLYLLVNLKLTTHFSKSAPFYLFKIL
eukprot:Awhi_evm1s5321